MRWSAYANGLSPQALSQLVNLLTAGKGYAFLAARAAERDYLTADVLRHLDAALRQLSTFRRLLDGERESPPAAPPPAAADLAALSWRAFLETRPPQDAAQLRAALTDAMFYLQRTAEVLREDGDLTWLKQRLSDGVQRLTLARALCSVLLSV